MKLVDILARELKEWPIGCKAGREGFMVQDLGDGNTVWFSEFLPVFAGGEWDSRDGIFRPEILKAEQSSDYANSIVTRAQWQEAREALSKPAKPGAPMPPISEAPKDATHWDPGIKCTPSWMLHGSDGVWYWHPAKVAPIEAGWRIIHMEGEHRNSLIKIERPWNGEGLPPVGAYCEAAMLYGEWAKGLVIAHHFDGAVVAVGDDERGFEYDSYQTNQVRPIRTPEQIAAEERENFIDELIKVTCIRRGEAGLIYDAGYRKVNDGNQKA